MAGVEARQIAFSESGSESLAMHAFTEVGLFSHDARWLILSKVLIRKKIFLEEKWAALDVLLIAVHNPGLSWEITA